MAKNNINISLGVDLKNLKKGFEEAIKITNGASKEAEQEAKEMAQAINQQLGKIAGQSTMRGAIRQMENLAGQMSAFGLEGTKAFNEVIKKTADLKAQQSDLKDLIEASRPDAPFKALQNTLHGAANAFAGAQGAMALFGAESEDTQKVLLKVQAAMAFAQGFEAIDQLNDGFKQLNATMRANPVLFIAAGIAALGVAMDAYASSVSEADKTQRKINAALDKAYESTIKQRLELESLSGTINSNTASEKEKLAAEQALIDKFPQYYGNLVAGKDGHDKFTAAIKNQITSLTALAEAQAVQEAYIETLKEKRKLERELIDSKRTMLGQESIDADILQKLIKVRREEKALKEEMLLLDKKAAALTPPTPPKVTPPAPTPTVQTTKAAKEPKQLFPTNDLIQFNQVQQETFKTSENILAQEEVHWYKWADSVTEANAIAKKAVEDANAAIVANIENSIESTIISVAEAVGSGLDPFTAFLSAFADSLSNLGKLLIAQGIALKAVQVSIDPATKIIAGAAAVIAGSAIKANIRNSPTTQKFADGGIVGGNSFQGDKVPALVNSGEMILNKAQQANLFKMINAGGGFQVVTVPIIDNEGLAMRVEIGNKRRKR